MRNRLMIAFIIIMAVPMFTAKSQDMRENTFRSLFSDQKATRSGDAVTVLIIESSSASNDARTTSSRESGISLSASGGTGSTPSLDAGGKLGTGNQFRGEGATSNRGSVRARMSAQVDSVLANGNLVISGKRKITINGEEQTISLSGIVRTSDVQSDNSVFSYNIADAVIMIEGDGPVSKVQGPGWVTKIFHWLF